MVWTTDPQHLHNSCRSGRANRSASPYPPAVPMSLSIITLGRRWVIHDFHRSYYYS
jgi:hypothetical protein